MQPLAYRKDAQGTVRCPGSGTADYTDSTCHHCGDQVRVKNNYRLRLHYVPDARPTEPTYGK